MITLDKIISLHPVIFGLLIRTRTILKVFVTPLAMMLATLVPSVSMAADQNMSASDKALIKRAEAYFDNIGTLQSQFIQTNPDGSYLDGTIILKRPGKMRIDYGESNPVEVIADGTFFILVDHQLEEVSYLPLSQTPAHLLLRDDFTLGDDIMADAVDQGAGLVRLRLVRKGEEAIGSVTVTLNANPMQLRQWVIEDAQGLQTRVTLLDPRFGMPLDDTLFSFQNPYAENREGGSQ